jgi:hypothetical protein
MANGVDVDIVDGRATLTFASASVRDATLVKLLELGGPTAVTVDTGGLRRSYVVTEDLAYKADLVDKPKRRASRKSS